MKQSFLVLLGILSFSILKAQAPEIISDSEGKILKGFVNRQVLATDSAFKWFAENQKGYTPYPAALQTLKTNKKIPLTHEGLISLKGIGSKSANVILREAGKPAEGVIVDLHVVRVAPRLGMATGSDPKKIEKQIKEILPQKLWDAGMAMSFLGREICRPKPKCELCLMRPVCLYYNTVIKKSRKHGSSK